MYDNLEAAGQEEEEQPSMLVPATLPVVEAEDAQRKDDEEKLRFDGPCPLCMIEDDSIPGASETVSDIFSTERKYRDKMSSKHLHKTIKEKANRVLKKAKETRQGKRLGVQKVRCAAVRRHFNDRHDKDPRRLMERSLDYLNAEIETLKRSGSLWQRDTKSQVMIPDDKNHGLLLRLIQRITATTMTALRYDRLLVSLPSASSPQGEGGKSSGKSQGSVIYGNAPFAFATAMNNNQ